MSAWARSRAAGGAGDGVVGAAHRRWLGAAGVAGQAASPGGRGREGGLLDEPVRAPPARGCGPFAAGRLSALWLAAWRAARATLTPDLLQCGVREVIAPELPVGRREAGVGGWRPDAVPDVSLVHLGGFGELAVPLVEAGELEAGRDAFVIGSVAGSRNWSRWCCSSA